MTDIPKDGFLRLRQIIGHPGDPKTGAPSVPPLIPIGRSTWWLWVREGKAPKPIKLGPRMTAWRADQIRALIADMAA